MKYYRLQGDKVFEIKQKHFNALEDLIVFDDSYQPIPEDWWVEEIAYQLVHRGDCVNVCGRPQLFIWRDYES